MKNIFLPTLLLMLSLGFANAQDTGLIIKTFPQPYLGHENDYYGGSVDLDSNYAIIGAPNFNNYTGYAFIARKTNKAWENIAKLTKNGGQEKSWFGDVVRLKGDLAVVKSKNALNLFFKGNGRWEDMTETAILELPGKKSISGFDMSDSIIVACRNNDTLYLFEKPAQGWENTNHSHQLAISNFTGSFNGQSIKVLDDVVFVGNWLSDNNGYKSGLVAVFCKPAAGWANMSESCLLYPDGNDEYDEFGLSLDAFGDILMASGKGRAYLFQKSGLDWQNAQNIAELIPKDVYANQNPYMGLSENMAIIGVPKNYGGGSVFVFEKPDTGWVTTDESLKINPLSNLDNSLFSDFGKSVGVFENTFVAGARWVFDGKNVGKVFFLEYPGSVAFDNSGLTGLSPPPMNQNDLEWQRYGRNLELDGDFAVVGAPGYNSEMGCAYVLSNENGDWDIIARLTASDGYDDERFGYLVSISGGLIVVASEKNSVYLFEKPIGGWVDMTETAILSTSPESGISSIENNGNTVIVGTEHIDRDGFVKLGAAYVFQKPNPGWKDTVETFVLESPVKEDFRYFGKFAKLYANNLLIGSIDKGYIFNTKAGWNEQMPYISLNPPNSNVIARSSVALDKDLAVMNYSDGKIYVYEKKSAEWDNTSPLASIDVPESKDNTTIHIGLSGNLLALSSINQYYEGNVYVYKKPEQGWGQAKKPHKMFERDIGYISAIDLDDGKIAIGSPYNDEFGRDAGLAYFCNDANQIINLTDKHIFSDTYKVYPNPATNKISVENKHGTETVLVLFNNLGQQLLATTTHKTIKTIDLTSYPNGIYFLEIKNRRCSTTKMVLKMGG